MAHRSVPVRGRRGGRCSKWWRSQIITLCRLSSFIFGWFGALLLASAFIAVFPLCQKLIWGFVFVFLQSFFSVFISLHRDLPKLCWHVCNRQQFYRCAFHLFLFTICIYKMYEFPTFDKRWWFEAFIAEQSDGVTVNLEGCFSFSWASSPAGGPLRWPSGLLPWNVNR